jgi:4-amino-4-deoxy-L-arabinose transferase-like glycosyltransferase
MRNVQRIDNPRWGTDIFWLGLILIIGFIVRLDFLIKTNFVIDADEAIVGLMAKHMLEGDPVPIFYYGQSYMGSLEPILTAIVFKFFGISNATLKIVPLTFSIILIALVYLLARRFTSRFGARVAAFFAAIGPSTFILWSTKARGGFIELVALGTLALIISIDILKKRNPSRIEFFILGLVLGLAWWVNNQAIFYIVPIGIVFCYHFLKFYGLTSSIKLATISSFGFFLGGLPFWYANLFYTPRLDSFRMLAQKASFVDALSYFQRYFTEALPILLGSRRFWSTEDIFPGATHLVILLYLIVLGVVIHTWIFGADGVFRPESKFLPTRRPLGLLLLFCITTPVIFASSRFGWLTQAPRYLLPIYSVLFVFVGQAVNILRTSPYWGTKALCFGLLSFIFIIQISSNYARGGAIPGQPIVFAKDRVALDHTELYQWLDNNNYSHIKTNYWIGYRIAFETLERITFSRFRGPHMNRIPEYEALANEYKDHTVLLLTPSEAILVAKGLAQLGYVFRQTPVSGYSIIDFIEPLHTRGETIGLSPEQIFVSSNKKNVSGLIDDDLGTRWGTGAPQEPGMYVEISFESPVMVSGLDIDLSFWWHDYPRALLIEVKRDNGQWCMLADTLNNHSINYLLEGQTKWQFNFSPVKIRSIRLTQMGEDPRFDWSIADIKLFGPLIFSLDRDM